MANPPRTPQAADGEKPRWKYRFSNYQRAFSLLREAMEMRAERDLTDLEKEGTIQRFEYTCELAWKVMADYLEHSGIVFTNKTPLTTIRTAMEANLIENGQSWMNALDARNKMSHTYDFKKFEAVIADINAEYLAIMESLYHRLLEEDIE